MQALFKSLIALALCGLAALASASPADPKNGTEYLTLPEVQNTDSGNKIEVTEFFAYYCPHCHAYEPVLAAWVKKQSDKISFKRVHVAHHPSVVPQQRLYYTLEAMGLVEQYHAKVFAAMHEQRLRLSTDEQVFDWAASAGLDRAKFIDVYQAAPRQCDDGRLSCRPVADGGHRRPLPDLALPVRPRFAGRRHRGAAAAMVAAGDGFPGRQGESGKEIAMQARAR
jgi:thiol-disulfide isomerase/thioredoxin